MDGAGNEKDSSALQDSSESGKETSTEAPTQEQIVEKAVSDALSKAGRDAKSLTEREERLVTEKADHLVTQATWQKERDAEEDAKYADDMPALIKLRAERKDKADDTANKTELTNRETKVAQRETELDEIIKRDGTRKRTELAAEVAQDKGVSADSILKGAKDDSREAMETIAELLPKVDPLPVILSHNTRGGKGGTDWRELSADEKINYALANPKK